MSYSKAYQEIVAGRVREEEALPLLKKASVGRVTDFVNLSAEKQPKLDVDHMRHTGIGKKGTESDNVSAYNWPPMASQ